MGYAHCFIIVVVMAVTACTMKTSGTQGISIEFIAAGEIGEKDSVAVTVARKVSDGCSVTVALSRTGYSDSLQMLPSVNEPPWIVDSNNGNSDTTVFLFPLSWFTMRQLASDSMQRGGPVSIGAVSNGAMYVTATATATCDQDETEVTANGIIGLPAGRTESVDIDAVITSAAIVNERVILRVVTTAKRVCSGAVCSNGAVLLSVASGDQTNSQRTRCVEQDGYSSVCTQHWIFSMPIGNENGQLTLPEHVQFTTEFAWGSGTNDKTSVVFGMNSKSFYTESDLIEKEKRGDASKEDGKPNQPNYVVDELAIRGDIATLGPCNTMEHAAVSQSGVLYVVSGARLCLEVVPVSKDTGHSITIKKLVLVDTDTNTKRTAVDNGRMTGDFARFANGKIRTSDSGDGKVVEFTLSFDTKGFLVTSTWSERSTGANGKTSLQVIVVDHTTGPRSKKSDTKTNNKVPTVAMATTGVSKLEGEKPTGIDLKTPQKTNINELRSARFVFSSDGESNGTTNSSDEHSPERSSGHENEYNHTKRTQTAIIIVLGYSVFVLIVTLWAILTMVGLPTAS